MKLKHLRNMKIFMLANSASNPKYFKTTMVSITSASSLVSNGINYSVVGSRPSLNIS